MACYATGTTRLTNIASWRVKETDRIAAMATELRKLGAQVVEGTDFIEVTAPTTWCPAAIHTYDDHRIAMCFALAAFNALAGAGASRAAAQPVRILDPKCVAKTFPDYFETLFAVARTAVDHIPVIAIDGPSASGKGTVASAVARKLGYHFLDSGAVYRDARWSWLWRLSAAFAQAPNRLPLQMRRVSRPHLRNPPTHRKVHQHRQHLRTRHSDRLRIGHQLRRIAERSLRPMLLPPWKALVIDNHISVPCFK